MPTPTLTWTNIYPDEQHLVAAVDNPEVRSIQLAVMMTEILPPDDDEEPTTRYSWFLTRSTGPGAFKARGHSTDPVQAKNMCEIEARYWSLTRSTGPGAFKARGHSTDPVQAKNMCEIEARYWNPDLFPREPEIPPSPAQVITEAVRAMETEADQPLHDPQFDPQPVDIPQMVPDAQPRPAPTVFCGPVDMEFDISPDPVPGIPGPVQCGPTTEDYQFRLLEAAIDLVTHQAREAVRSGQGFNVDLTVTPVSIEVGWSAR